MNENARTVVDEMTSAFSNLNYERVMELLTKALSQTPPEDIMKGMQAGMVAVGKKYEEHEYFLAELVAAGEIMKEGLDKLAPYLHTDGTTTSGTVVIGTVRGDVHDMGKNLVKILFQSSGFTVYDLGIDVSPEAFVNKVKEIDADILAMSALLTTTMNEMGVVIKELERSGLRSKVHVIVGGYPITKEFGKEIGANVATKDALLGVEICKKWMREKRS